MACIISGNRKKGKRREEREPEILGIHNSISCVTRDRTEKAVETLPGGKRLNAAAGLTDEEKGKARQEHKMPNGDKYVSREEEA